MKRQDIPSDLISRARAVDPALVAWLEAAYPTDEEHDRRQAAKRRAAQKQLALNFERERAA